MWDAIHKETGKRYYAWDVWTPGIFDDPHDEKWIASPDNIINWDELGVDEIQLSIVKGHFRKEHLVRTFFRIQDCDKAETKPESEEHKRKKTLISLLLTHNTPIFLVYDTEKYPISILPIDREKIRDDFKTIEVRRKIINHSYKQTDVLIPFIYSNYWGNGLAIEIKESEGDDTKEGKEEFWFTRGYSMIWVDKTDFIETGYGIKKNELSVIPYSIGQFFLRNRFEKKLLNILKEFQKENKDLIKIRDMIERFPRYIETEYDKYNTWWLSKKNYLTKKMEKYIKKIELIHLVTIIEKEEKNKEGGLDPWM